MNNETACHQKPNQHSFSSPPVTSQLWALLKETDSQASMESFFFQINPLFPTTWNFKTSQQRDLYHLIGKTLCLGHWQMRSGEPPLPTSDAGCERGKCLPTSCLWHGSVHWCRLLKVRTWKKTPIFWKLGIVFWIAHPKHECYGPDSLQVHHVSRQSLLSLRLLVCTLPTSRQDNGNLKKKKALKSKSHNSLMKYVIDKALKSSEDQTLTEL